MKKLLDLIAQELVPAFEKAGYDALCLRKSQP